MKHGSVRAARNYTRRRPRRTERALIKQRCDLQAAENKKKFPLRVKTGTLPCHPNDVRRQAREGFQGYIEATLSQVRR